MLSDNPNAQFRRRLLEEVPETLSISSAKPFVNYRSLPTAANLASEYVLTQLEILEHEGRVELKRNGDDCVLKLTPLGWKSLEVTEDEWLRKESGVPVANSTRIDIRDSNVGNIAQVSGSHGTSINQTQHSNDLQNLTAAIDRLVEAVKTNPSVKPDTKNDAEIEAGQLKGELRKSKPNPGRIQEALEWFKALDGASTVIPPMLEVMDKLKNYLPGI
jgi:predicted transcriptional regulator